MSSDKILDNPVIHKSGKRHTSQTSQQKHGQYHTTNVDQILSGYEETIHGKEYIEPFAGGGDLIRWADKLFGVLVGAYDLHPTDSDTIQRDTIMDPPDYTDKFVLTNPPYLSKNKNKDKAPYDKWGASDLYKCHLASLKYCSGALIIIPSNFFCESRSRARVRLFESHYIVSAKYYDRPMFDNATTGICVIHIEKGVRLVQEFPMVINDDKAIYMSLKKDNNYIHGNDFFDLLRKSKSFPMKKTVVGDEVPNTKIIVSILDNGKYKDALTFNNGEDIYCKPKSFTTYQLTIVGRTITEDVQRQVVDMVNSELSRLRDKYHSMFLSNYMGEGQKILSRKYIHSMISWAIEKINENKP